jgi:hypothetical protein
VEIVAGATVLLDVATANRGGPSLSFGGGLRRCPAEQHALALAAGLLEQSTVDEVSATDDRDPGTVVTAMVSHVLALAATWTNWDGRPCPTDDRVYTPHKAVRRVTDHLLDHLAELEARLAGHQPRPDHWHASATVTPADLAPFTSDDLDEARSRLTRLADLWRHRLEALTPDQLDQSPGEGWTFRQLAFHLEGSTYYADAIGNLSEEGQPRLG